MSVAIGAQVYRGVQATMQHDYNLRTGALYLTEKLRANDSAQTVRVAQVAGGDALVLRDDYQGSTFETWIYVSDGHLVEETLDAGAKPNAAAAQAIMPMRAMALKLDAQGLLKADFVDASGHETTLVQQVRSGGGAR
jgi:hypothetical protein